MAASYNVRPFHLAKKTMQASGLREKTSDEIRAELPNLTDDELRKHGRRPREFCQRDRTGKVMPFTAGQEEITSIRDPYFSA